MYPHRFCFKAVFDAEDPGFRGTKPGAGLDGRLQGEPVVGEEEGDFPQGNDARSKDIRICRRPLGS